MKKIIITSGIVLALILLTAVAARFYLDPLAESFVRSYIEKNIPVRIEFEDVHISLFSLSLRVNGIKIYNEDEPEIKIKELAVYPSISALLKKQVKVKNIRVISSDVIIYPLEEGTNIAELLSRITGGNKEGAQDETHFSLSRLDVLSASVKYYFDKEKENFILISPLDITLENINTSKKESDLTFYGKTGINGGKKNIHIKGYARPFADEIVLDAEAEINKFLISGMPFLTGDALKISAGHADLKTSVNYTGGVLKISGIFLAIDNLEAEISAKKQLPQKISFKKEEFLFPENIEIESVNINVNEALFLFEGAENKQPVKIKNVSLTSGPLAYNVSDVPLKISAYIAAPSAKASADGSLKIASGVFSGTLKIKADVLRLSDLNSFLKRDEAQFTKGAASLSADLNYRNHLLKFGDISLNVEEMNAVLPSKEEADEKETAQPRWPKYLETNSFLFSIKNSVVKFDGAQDDAAFKINSASLKTEKLAYNIASSPFEIKASLQNPQIEGDATGALKITSGEISAQIKLKAESDELVSINPFIKDISPVRVTAGNLVLTSSGNISWNKIDLPVRTLFTGLRLQSESSGTVNRLIFGVPVPLIITYLSSSNGQLDLRFKVYGSVNEPKYNINEALVKILTLAGIDLGIMSTVGLPLFIGDKVLEHTTGVSVIKTGKEFVRNVFKKEEEADTE